jgi:signal transduction histidine kinase
MHAQEDRGSSSPGCVERSPLSVFEEAARALGAGAEAEHADEQIARLLSLAAALAGAATLDDVADALLSRAASPLGAEYAGIWLSEGDEAVLACVRGRGGEALDAVRRIEIAALAPASTVLLAGEPLWLSSPEELAAAFPGLAGVRAATGTQAWVGLPLRLLGRTLGLVGLGFLAPRTFGPLDRPLHRAIAHLAAQTLERVRLFHEERRARTRAEVLARLSADLAAGAHLERAAASALAPWTGSLGAAEATLWVVDPAGFRCVAETPPRGRVGGHERPAASPFLARALAHGRTVVATARSAQPHERLYLASAGLDACVAAPLIAPGEVRGLLCVGFRAEAGDPAAAAPDVETFAAHCAVGLQHGAAVERERATRRRLELAHALASALASARTSREILEVSLGHGLAAFGATAGLVALAGPEALEIIGDAGYPKPLVDGWRRIPFDAPVPLADAYRRGEPVWLETPEEAIARYPAVGGADDEQHRAWAALPLVGAEGRLGIMGLSFPRERPLDEEDRTAAVALARTCGLALDRARLYDAERRMRHAADAARAEAERIGALQEQLLAVVGHDLRQPLSAVVLAVRLLADAKRTPEAQQLLLGRIGKAADRMTAMIRDLLDLSRARQGMGVPVERERVDLAALAERVVDEAETLHPGRVRLEATGEAVVWADRSRLGQVVANLVANALEHGAPAIPVRVVVRREESEVVLEVWNGGTVPAQVLPRVFEPFARGGRRGLGLGLFIVREIVRAHGGSAELHSSEADGTVVRVRLPRAPPA